MEQKSTKREKGHHHPNFRKNRQPEWPRLPLGLILMMGILFIIVLGYEWSREKRSNWASQHANAPRAEPGRPEPSSGLAPDLNASNYQRPVKKPEPMAIATPSEPAINRKTRDNPTPSIKEKPHGGLEYVMERDNSGNIIGSGTINGKSVKFLADTGATMVVVPEAIALQIGLTKGNPVPFRTGGGVITHYATSLDSLTLGRIEIRNVPAAINPAMQDPIVLLGMSALEHMDMHMEQGNLVLRYKGSNPDSDEQQPVADVPFKRSFKECVGQGNKFDQKALDCLRGK